MANTSSAALNPLSSTRSAPLIGSHTAFSRVTFATQPVFRPYGIASKIRRNLLAELSYPDHKLVSFTFR